METNILKQIFFDQNRHWEKFVQKHRRLIRPVVLKEIKKFQGCGKVVNGFKLFVCEGCHHTKKVAYRCKGRFCTTCSVGESEEWSRILFD
ncbi:transposase zinc-binding domain-containing protein [Chryseomicrobium imtechense]